MNTLFLSEFHFLFFREHDPRYSVKIKGNAGNRKCHDEQTIIQTHLTKKKEKKEKHMRQSKRNRVVSCLHKHANKFNLIYISLIFSHPVAHSSIEVDGRRSHCDTDASNSSAWSSSQMEGLTELIHASKQSHLCTFKKVRMAGWECVGSTQQRVFISSK